MQQHKRLVYNMHLQQSDLRTNVMPGGVAAAAADLSSALHLLLLYYTCTACTAAKCTTHAVQHMLGAHVTFR
jgi:hypothetical protein